MKMIDTVAGLRLRPYEGEADRAEIVRIENAEAEADGIDERLTLEQLAARYAHPSERFQPERDVTIAEIEGRVVGVGERIWVETTDGLREYRLDGVVDPAWRRRGIGSALLADSERAMRELIAEHGSSARAVFGSWSGDTQTGDVQLLSRAGFKPVRWFFEMSRPLDGGSAAIPDVPLPDGLEIRPIDRDLARVVWQADAEAFRDHWGGFDDSEGSFERLLARPSTDMSLWLVAFEGDEVAGGVLNAIDAAENVALKVQIGWLGSVFTRREWRRRGLASALIARSLRLFADRGMEVAMLGVDADNPNGAVGIYERLGFRPGYRSTAWRKPL